MKMAALPSPTQVAGSHYSIYEAYYQLVDPNNQGSVGALDAAKFLKKSGLSDAILSKVWDLSDPNGKGYLNKSGFFVALKLVSLAQIGNDVSIASLMVDTPPPKMGDIPTVLQKNVINSVPATVSDWAMKPTERAKYDQLFDSLQPLNGVIPGNKVKGLLIDSKLPVDTLGRIWDLADMDKDGSLDRHEFVVAMHLVYKALEKYAIPSCLPPELLPPGKRKESISNVPVIPVTSVIPIVKPEPPKPSIPLEPQATWVVSGEERARYDTLFIQTDVDKDGFVSGFEIKDVFLQSGVPQQILAHIWGLCDVKQTGKLNSEQFALSMWLINQKLKGIDPPKVLSPEMVPPCNRNKPAEPLVENNNTTPYSNPELDMITKDIEELVREKQSLESEILQKEADIKIKNGEVKSLQGELDTLAATLKQLESQKGEAQKRLNDLKNQTALIESELSDVNLQLDAEQIQVDNLRRQAEEQETSLKEQEEELVNKKQELEGLKQEETRLEQQQEEFRERLETISQNLQESQLQISQVKASISQVQEQQRQMKDAIALSETAISSGDASSVPDTCLNLQPEFREPSYTRLVSDQGENSNDPFSSLNGPADSGGETFTHNNAFNNDPFQNVVSNSAPDPFASSNHFSSSFTSKPTDAFSSDPFSSFGNSLGKSDPFDPFTDGSNRTATKSPDDMAGKDPFGCDPFASLHPPTSGGPPPRPESPSPALPPKKSKQPPPRPAPPKALLQSTTPSPDPFSNNPSSQSDPFSMEQQNDPFTSNANPGGFADFSNFNSKCSQSSNLPEPVNITYNCLVTMSQSEAGAQLVVNFPKQLWSHLLKQFSDTTGIEKAAPAVPTVKLDFTEDPFRDYRYEDPFNIADPFDDTPPVRMTPEGSSKLDPFGMEVVAPPQNKGSGKSSPISGKATPINGKSTPSPLPSEDQQLAWAACESLRLEEERRRAAEQERVDLKRALALSKKEGKKRTSALSRILS